MSLETGNDIFLMKAAQFSRSCCRNSSSVLPKQMRRCPVNCRVLLNRVSFSTTSPGRADVRNERISRDNDAATEETQNQLEHLELGRNLQAAPEIDLSQPDSKTSFDRSAREAANREKRREEVRDRLRLLPASPSYFTFAPNFTDEFIRVEELARRYLHLPCVKASEIPVVRWRDWRSYNAGSSEPIKFAPYNRLVAALKRMNQIQPALMPAEVRTMLDSYIVDQQQTGAKVSIATVDNDGIASAIGRRKTSSARAWVVEGEGEFLVNGKRLTHAFARLHDRESVIWPLKATQRTDRYNIWATVNGGGSTGQAEALTLAIAKALVVHEPSLKRILREAGCIHRDPRMVERKKPGRLKARKKPAWVKR